MDRTLTEFTAIEEVDDVEAALERGDLLMISVPREVAEKETNKVVKGNPIFGEFTTEVDRIIIGGYNATARHIIRELDETITSDYHFSILTFEEDEAAAAEADGFDVIFSSRMAIKASLSQACTKSTLMVNLFQRLTDSLLVNTVVERIDRDIYIVQLAYNRIETDVLIRSGVDRILIPDVLMSRGMLLILMSTKGFMNSMVWSNSHIFEHYVDHDSPLKHKRTRDLRKLGYTPLLYRTKVGEVIEHVGDLTLQEGDNILLEREHDIMQSSDQFIDPHH